MVDLIEALRERISSLQDRKAELQVEIASIEAKLEAYADLLQAEAGEVVSLAPAKKKAGRPKGSGKTPAPPTRVASAEAVALYKEATATLQSMGGGTDPEKAKQIAQRFTPVPRQTHDYGKNVRVPNRKEMKRMRQGVPADMPDDTEGDE
jgi:hypothetical protein